MHVNSDEYNRLAEHEKAKRAWNSETRSYTTTKSHENACDPNEPFSFHDTAENVSK